jgi:hypothetical protein
MIDTTTMLELVRDTLAADARIEAFCRTNYSRSIALYLGFNDDKDALSSTAYPLAEIYSASRLRGADKHRNIWDVEISAQIVNDTEQSISNGITYTGFLHAEELRDLIENALYRAKIASIDSAGASGTFSNYPLFEAVTKIRITLIADARSGISKRL